MTYVIAEPCIDVLDLACVSVCPVDCIHYDEGTDRKLFIDPNECIDCGACEPECPVNAIFFEDDVPDQWKDYVAVNADWFKSHEVGGAFRARRLPARAAGKQVAGGHRAPHRVENPVALLRSRIPLLPGLCPGDLPGTISDHFSGSRLR